MTLAALIRADQATWDDPLVDRAVFGTSDAEAIAGIIDGVCRDALGAAIAHARFYSVSVGCVAGVELDDGRAVVLKFTRGHRRLEYLATCCALREHLRARGYPCPAHVLGPLPVGESLVTVESFEGDGERGDGHDPRIRKAIAGALWQLVDLAAGFDRPLSPSWYSGLPDGQLWPVPHSPLFDFDATRAGAEWIDAIASEAIGRRGEAAGGDVIGHYDFRVEHLRFAGDRVVASYDWDSVHRDRETVLVGLTSLNFTADWQREPATEAPSLAEMRAFVADYEAARGRPFTNAERRTIGAAAVYSMAYRARCSHAIAARLGYPGDVRPRLAADARALLGEGM